MAKLLPRASKGEENEPAKMVLKPEEVPSAGELTAIVAALFSGRGLNISEQEQTLAPYLALSLWRNCTDLRNAIFRMSSDRKQEQEHLLKRWKAAAAYAGKHRLYDIFDPSEISWNIAVTRLFPWHQLNASDREKERRFRESEVLLEQAVTQHELLNANGWKQELEEWKSSGFRDFELVDLVGRIAEAELAEEERIEANKKSARMSALAKKNAAKKKAKREAQKTGGVRPQRKK